ncbi:MAG: lysophospholipase [Turicibacter sp.]
MKMKDGQYINLYVWDSVEWNEIKGIVQLVHGSCEHAMRYDAFAKFLNEQGFIVYANDHRGHGKSVNNEEDFGYFGEVEGWQHMVDDLYEINQMIHDKYPHASIVMLGHSMGSFLSRHYAIDYGQSIDGLILSGTAHNPKVLLSLGCFISSCIKSVKGSKHRSKFINKMSYDSFNKPYKDARTTHEWLTQDTKMVDEFLADDACGFIFTTAGFKDMFEGLLYITNQKNIEKMPKTLPTYFISGEADPVGGNGKMVSKAYNAFIKAGITSVQMKLYPTMRHEILNELEKETVYNDILVFLHQITK